MTSHHSGAPKALNELSLMRIQNSNDGGGSGAAQGSLDGHFRGRKKVGVPRQPNLPKEDIKIVLRPRDRLNVSRIIQAPLKDGILRGAALKAEETTEDTFRTNNFKSSIVASTAIMERSAKYNRITELSIGGQMHESTAYATPPEDSTKGVIHNFPVENRNDDITHSLAYRRNPRILQARRLGKTNSSVIVFEGELLLCRGVEYRAYMQEKTP
ncbi:hypothetical protein HPB48_010703 [Haemaphysalis longicornis]|uniref:Uncharacterized protein n=1 Tax=Haemaphysalis longicornis TaxID=44386 RepID=A0A9J6GCI6_HAELO|nr:hypothetical protein HPB48_010703 [Haemaphysalis longicornis]